MLCVRSKFKGGKFYPLEVGEIRLAHGETKTCKNTINQINLNRKNLRDFNKLIKSVP